ncbi:MAG: hypothetical protein K2X77_14020 [Candidatus Obscuribacterales bacterium]|jgi:macrodomain Ter protein organizer (MatP/YcbG family)|nr:hypothetical protein [Candidatus Obscuribacterales bacterium]
MSSEDLSVGSTEKWSDEQKWSYLVRHERIGELLVRQGKLTLGQLEEVLTAQENTTKHLGEIIVEKKMLTLDEILQALDKQKRAVETSEHSINSLKQKNKD